LFLEPPNLSFEVFETANRSKPQEKFMKTIQALQILLAGALLALGLGAAHAAAPPAGAVIGNQATATYNDAGGTPRIATSNLVQTTVSQVKSFSLAAPGARTAAPGQTVYYPHTIQNTGNGTDTYTLVTPPTSGSFGAAGPHTSMQFFIDANGDGVPDNAVPINTTGPIAANGVFRFVVAGTVPATAASGDTASITVSVQDTTPTTLTNLDTTTVATSVITVTKSLSVTQGPAPNAGPITVTLSYTNSGTSPATGVQLTDTLPVDMTYLANSGRWSGSGATILGDGAGGDPAGITYQVTGQLVTATIATVPAGFSGTVSFDVSIGARGPGFVNNTAQYVTSSQLSSNTNTASYEVKQTGGVVANGSLTSSVNGTGEPVPQAAAAAGATFPFTDVIWNTGNSADTFTIGLAGQGAWPAGTTFTLLQADGVTSLIANTTPSIPLYAGSCPAGYQTDATPGAQRCGYKVIVRVQLPAAATGGPYNLTLSATSTFDNTKSDTVINTLTAVTANSVDLTNNVSVATATPADGLGNTGTTVITNTPVSPSTTTTSVVRFRLFVNNTGAVNDNFNLSTAGTPAGWSVVFKADGGVGNCSTVGATLTSTGTLNAGTNRLVCAEVTIPVAGSGQAAVGQYNLDFTVVSATNPAVTDVKRDAVTVQAVNSVTVTPNNIQQTFPGGSVTYSHVVTNLGNVTENITFTAGFLTDSRSGQGWTSTAYVDGNNNGIFEPGVDDVPANAVSAATTFALAPSAARTIFVRVFAPPSATGADPANVTLLTARYNAGAASATATDTTSVTDGLVLNKRQRTINCDGTLPGTFSAAPIAAGPATAPGKCLQYEIVAQNTTALSITAVVVKDNIPGSTTQHNACGAPAVAPAGPVVTSPGDGLAGTISVAVGPLAPGQTSTLTFCVQIDQ
jgi:uncharacterized repeat protein (TIGR01451 family)